MRFFQCQSPHDTTSIRLPAPAAMKGGFVMSRRILCVVSLMFLLTMASPCAAQWVWQNPLPQGNHIEGIWGSYWADVFAVGKNGTILHGDGWEWTSMDSGTTEWLRGVWGSAGNDVFAVGGNGTILHYDGASWSKMNSDEWRWLIAIWGAAANDVYAVGES